MTKYKIKYDGRKEFPGQALLVQGPKGTRRVQRDGKMWKVDGRKYPEESAVQIVDAEGYLEARKKFRRK